MLSRAGVQHRRLWRLVRRVGGVVRRSGVAPDRLQQHLDVDEHGARGRRHDVLHMKVVRAEKGHETHQRARLLLKVAGDLGAIRHRFVFLRTRPSHAIRGRAR